MYFVFVIETRHKSPVAIVKSHRKKCQNYFRETSSPFAKSKLDDMPEWKGIKEKMMDFDYCEKYLTSISNKILLWQS